VNFYPELSCREFVLVDGAPVGVAFNGWTDGLRQVLGEFDERYGIPLMISETAVEGDPEHLVSWLRDCAEEVSRLRADGAHIVGLTWWPLFDFVDWSWGSGGRIVEEFYTRVNGVVSPVIPPPPSGGIASYFRRMGMWRLREGESSIDRERTAVVDAYRSLAGQPYASIEEQKVT
jgi:beta-glucosidase